MSMVSDYVVRFSPLGQNALDYAARGVAFLKQAFKAAETMGPGPSLVMPFLPDAPPLPKALPYTAQDVARAQDYNAHMDDDIWGDAALAGRDFSKARCAPACAYTEIQPTMRMIDRLRYDLNA